MGLFIIFDGSTLPLGINDVIEPLLIEERFVVNYHKNKALSLIQRLYVGCYYFPFTEVSGTIYGDGEGFELPVIVNVVFA